MLNLQNCFGGNVQVPVILINYQSVFCVHIVRDENAILKASLDEPLDSLDSLRIIDHIERTL